MIVSRLMFRTTPGQTHHAEQELEQLQALVDRLCGVRPRVLRAHLTSLGAPDVVFEQEAPDITSLESQIRLVANSSEFQEWTGRMSGLLREPAKREIYLVVEAQEPMPEAIREAVVAAELDMSQQTMAEASGLQRTTTEIDIIAR